jgi:alkylated DNA repair dioxygenase AlkB
VRKAVPGDSSQTTPLKCECGGLPSGVVVLRGFLSCSQQAELLREFDRLNTETPAYIPSMLMYGKQSFMNAYLLSAGQHWSATTRKYGPVRDDFDGRPAAPVPALVRALHAKALAHIGDSAASVDSSRRAGGSSRGVSAPGTTSPFPLTSTADLALFNYYAPGWGKMGPHRDREESALSRSVGDAVVSFSIGDSADFVLYPEPHMWPEVGPRHCYCGLASASAAGAKVRPAVELNGGVLTGLEPSTAVGAAAAVALVSDSATRKLSTRRVASTTLHDPALLSGHKRARADVHGLDCSGTGLPHAEPAAPRGTRTKEKSLSYFSTAVQPKQLSAESLVSAGCGIGSPASSSDCHKLAPRTERPTELTLRLNSGDVVMFGGSSRLIKHAVARVHRGSKPPDVPMIPGRLNITVRTR